MRINSMNYSLCTDWEMNAKLDVMFDSASEMTKLSRDLNECRIREFVMIPKDELYTASTRSHIRAYLNNYYDMYGTYRGARDEKVPSLKEVIFNEPATICIWSDGTKTIVKCEEGETFDKEKGIALCFMKKINGNKGNYNNIFKKFIKEEEEC